MSKPVEQPSALPAPDVGAYLAERLHEMRQARGLSLDRAAQLTGISKAMLGQIERRESSPTVATLWKIASGFQCALSHFITPPATVAGQTLFRNAAKVRRKPASDDMLVAPLFPYDPHFAFEWLELTLLPGYVRLSEAHAAGVTEHVVVLKGRMEILVEDRWQTLSEGSAARFAADQPHGYRNLSEEQAVCHNLIHYPSQAPSTP